MDSIVREKPIPKIFIRQDIDPKTKTTVREVVDGQQRLRTIFSFLQDGFKINKCTPPTAGVSSTASYPRMFRPLF